MDIAFIGPDARLYRAASDGSAVAPLSGDDGAGRRAENWPAWSPDGRWLAFSRMQLRDDALTAGAVYVTSNDGQHQAEVIAAEQFAPIYLSWSPDSRWLTLLLQDQDGLSLHLAEILDGRPGALHPIDRGAPLFTSWSADSHQLFMHVGGDRRVAAGARLALLEVEGASQPRILEMAPASFNAPACAPDGSGWAYASPVAERDGLFVEQDGQSRLLAEGHGFAFNWAPNDGRLAFTSQASPADNFYTGLALGSERSQVRQLVPEDRLVAFFWAPDGQWLAYFSPTADGLTLTVIDADGRNPRPLAAFTPTNEFTQLVSFFDQYAQSHRLWSPDSSHILFAGTRSAGNGASNRPHVFSAAADGSSPPGPIADGVIGFFSPVL